MTNDADKNWPHLHKLLQRFQLQKLAFCDQFLRVTMLSDGG